jgi:hypothetical protein
MLLQLLQLLLQQLQQLFQLLQLLQPSTLARSNTAAAMTAQWRSGMGVGYRAGHGWAAGAACVCVGYLHGSSAPHLSRYSGACVWGTGLVWSCIWMGVSAKMSSNTCRNQSRIALYCIVKRSSDTCHTRPMHLQGLPRAAPYKPGGTRPSLGQGLPRAAPPHPRGPPARDHTRTALLHSPRHRFTRSPSTCPAQARHVIFCPPQPPPCRARSVLAWPCSQPPPTPPPPFPHSSAPSNADPRHPSRQAPCTLRVMVSLSMPEALGRIRYSPASSPASSASTCPLSLTPRHATPRHATPRHAWASRGPAHGLPATTPRRARLGKHPAASPELRSIRAPRLSPVPAPLLTPGRRLASAATHTHWGGGGLPCRGGGCGSWGG